MSTSVQPVLRRLQGYAFPAAWTASTHLDDRGCKVNDFDTHFVLRD